MKKLLYAVSSEAEYIEYWSILSIELTAIMFTVVVILLVCPNREIASGIKKLLDAVSSVAEFIPGPQGKQTLEQKKRDFVKHSKRFSNTLKEYFKEGQWVLLQT